MGRAGTDIASTGGCSQPVINAAVSSWPDTGGFIAALDDSAGEVAGDSKKRSGRQAMVGYMKGNVHAIASYDVPRDAANLKQKVIVAGGNYRCDNQARVLAG